MSGETQVRVLTPPGTGAIATIEVSEPGAWKIVSELFRPVGNSLPEKPELNRFWFGRLGTGVGDEVILAVTSITPEVCVEIHCHGGRRVVQWIVEQIIEKGSSSAQTESEDNNPWFLLRKATTLRTASILLDQAQGAFATAIRQNLELIGRDPKAAAGSLQELVRFAGIGCHLVEPWKVVIAGPPNVGKSSLMNALAGYQRAIVSEIAGTTRDVVTVQVAFDGWPVELTDTAGLREAEGLEAEGIERARRVLHEADMIVWVLDASLATLMFPDVETAFNSRIPVTDWLLALNKTDIAPISPPDISPDVIRVSAVTKEGLPELIAAIVSRLVPHLPLPGVAVPYSPALAELVIAADEALNLHRIEEAIEFLNKCLVSI